MKEIISKRFIREIGHDTYVEYLVCWEDSWLPEDQLQRAKEICQMECIIIDVRLCQIDQESKIEYLVLWEALWLLENKVETELVQEFESKYLP
jgi:hypothetical protein